jgi:hypothetical protein
MIMLGQSLVTKTTYSHFPAKESSHKKQKYRSNESLTFYDLHQMALIGLHVTQYMYVLFDKVHIYVQKSHFTLVLYGQ